MSDGLEARMAAATERFACALAEREGEIRSRVAERRERRSGSVLEWHVFETSARVHRLVLKAAAPASAKAVGRMSRDAQAAAELAAILRDDPALGVVCPEAFYPDLGVSLSPAIDAPNLLQLATANARWRPSEARLSLVTAAALRAGRWLRTVQDATRAGRGCFDVAAFVDYVALRVDRLADVRPPRGIAAKLAAQVRPALQRHLARVPADRLALAAAHGDFSPSNLLCEDARLVALDFTEFQEASPLFDPTRFLHQVGLLALSPGFRRRSVDAIAQAFLEGYGHPALDRHPLFLPFMIRHTVTHWLGRVKRSRTLLEQADALRLCLAHRRALQRDLSNLAA
jgi:hypothetical protein